MAGKLKVADVMTHEVTTVFEESNLLPVVDGKRLVGILSQRDLLQMTCRGCGTSAAHSGGVHSATHALLGARRRGHGRLLRIGTNPRAWPAR
jgi:hypothetical protein